MSEYEHKVYQEIQAAVRALANQMLNKANLSNEQENNVRYMLNENVRFYK